MSVKFVCNQTFHNTDIMLIFLNKMLPLINQKMNPLKIPKGKMPIKKKVCEHLRLNVCVIRLLHSSFNEIMFTFSQKDNYMEEQKVKIAEDNIKEEHEDEREGISH